MILLLKGSFVFNHVLINKFSLLGGSSGKTSRPTAANLLDFKLQL